jgi:hypothetical protein
VAKIRLEVTRHLSQYSQYQSAGFSEANVTLRVLPGSVVIEVTISGKQVDGASLARQLESDVETGRLEMLVTIGYVPQSAGPQSQLAEPLFPPFLWKAMLVCLQWGVVASHRCAKAISRINDACAD